MLKIDEPSPKWYRIFNTIYPIIENAVLGALMIFQVSQNSAGLLMFKLISSTLRQAIDSIIAEDQNQTNKEKQNDTL